MAGIRSVFPDLDLPQTRFLEFGAGWDLTIPLTYAAMGVRHQTLIDLRTSAQLDLINHGLARLGAHLSEYEEIARQPLAIDPTPVRNMEALADRYGIRWFCPVDACDTKFDSGSFDVITNSSVMEHLAPDILVAALRESRRLLVPGGVMSCEIYMEDHWAMADPSISVYNFLCFSEEEWRPFNPDTHYQNRLRLPDYLSAVAESGFELLQTSPAWPTAEDLATLDRLPLDAYFTSKYTREELGVKSLWLLLRKTD